MYQKKLDEKCQSPLEYTLKIFGGKWNVNIFCIIVKHGPIGFNEIKKKIPEISDPVLSTALKQLLINKIIKRDLLEETRRVEYKITEKGTAIIPALQSLCNWFIKYNASEDYLEFDSYCMNCPIIKQSE